ncbi:DUF3280 domain-containing protein [Ancylobacter sp. A5.8]|uniref:DUF2380 domain-containing protein n=1 Tax=Ancylobacter gelatini TaxID=2919920 RepID=UPI001F4EC62F|nr:DUF2380 domain-containing protein [Ancylobacter gelatini]MCJ8142422.1 DUF3280 domain-containing protein [Ancylobacter gelatini]
MYPLHPLKGWRAVSALPACALPACALAVGALALLMCAPLHAASARIAVVDIGFTDSSGEARDQAAVHGERQRALTEALSREVAAAGQLDTVHLACGEGCSLDAAGIEALRERARKAGAGFVLVGKVHKMSTLVMSMRLAVLDTASGDLVLERLLSFRGDNDAGWRHAGDYAAREVVSAVR